MRERASTAGRGPRCRGAGGLVAVALVVLVAWLPRPDTVRAQDLPTEVYPESFEPNVPGLDSDYYQRNDVQNQLLMNINRYHLSEANFWTKYREHHLAQARGDLLFALRYFPNHPTALYLMELVGKEMGQPDYAIQYYERALKMFPQHPYTRAQYGAYLVRLGARGAGIQELRAALAADSSLVQAQAWLEQALHETGEGNQANRGAGPGAGGAPPAPGGHSR